MKVVENKQQRLILFISVIMALIIGFFIPVSGNNLLMQVLKVLLFIGVFGVFYFLLFSMQVQSVKTKFQRSEEPDKRAGVGMPGGVLQNESWSGFGGAFKKSYEDILFIVRDAVVANSAAIYLKTEPETYEMLAGLTGNEIIHPLATASREGLVDLITKSKEPLLESNLPIGTELDGFPNFEIRSFVGVPLIWSDEIVGVLGLGSSTAESFGEEDLNIVERCGNVITQIMAVCHRGLQWETDQEVYAVHLSMERELLNAEDIDSAVNIFIQHAQKLFPFERFTLCTVDGNMGIIQSVYGQIDSLDKGRRFNLDDGLTGLVIKRKMPLLIGDLEEGDYVRPRFSKDEDHNHNMRSFLAVPLGRGENVWGSVSFESSTPNQYGEKGRDILTLLAGQFTTELERIQLMDQIRELKQGPIIFNDNSISTE